MFLDFDPRFLEFSVFYQRHLSYFHVFFQSVMLDQTVDA